jgi:hypothetical protein
MKPSIASPCGSVPRAWARLASAARVRSGDAVDQGRKYRVTPVEKIASIEAAIPSKDADGSL